VIAVSSFGHSVQFRQHRHKVNTMVRDREPREAEEGGFIPEMIRRTVERSVNAVLHSEDERRRFFSSLLPRDFLNNVAAQVDSTKREAVAMIGREMQQFLQNLNVGDELKKILTSVSFEGRRPFASCPMMKAA
jgi:hypothetical protein